MFAIAFASNFNGYLVGMAIGGLGIGLYMAVDLALVADVLPDKDNNAEDLGVLNIAGALPSSIAPAIAPVILAVIGGSDGSDGSDGVLYAVAGICSIIGGAAILPVSASDERLLHRRCASHQHRTHLRGQACGSPGHRKQQLIRPLAEKVAASASGLLVLVQWHPCLAVREHGVPETATKVVGPTLHRPP